MKKLLSLALCLILIAVCIPVFTASADAGQLKPVDADGYLSYEITDGTVNGDASIAYDGWYKYDDWPNGVTGSSGGVFACLYGGSYSLNIDVPYSGYYSIIVTGSTYNPNDNAYASVWVNGNEYYFLADHSDFSQWPKTYVSYYDYGISGFNTAGGIWLNAGANTVSVNTNNGWILVDRLLLQAASINAPDGSKLDEVISGITNLPETVTEENFSDIIALKEKYDALGSFDKTIVGSDNAATLNGKYELAKGFLTISIEHSIINDDGFSYQVEDGVFSPDESGENLPYVATEISGYTGTSAVNIAGGSVKLDIDVPYAGTYMAYFAASTENNENDKMESVFINDCPEMFVKPLAINYGKWEFYPISEYDYQNETLIPQELQLPKGKNTFKLQANWGYALYDRLVLVPVELTFEDSDPSAAVVDQIKALPSEISASDKADVQAVKTAYDKLDATQRVAVYNYKTLKDDFDALKTLYVIQPTTSENYLIYEAEDGLFTDKAFIGDDVNASGEKFVNIAWGTLIMNIYVPKTAYYDISLFGSTNSADSNKCDYVSVNGTQIGLTSFFNTDFGSWTESKPGAENWVDGKIVPLAPEGGIMLQQGNNLVEIRANWGNTNYDRLVLKENVIIGDLNNDRVLDALDLPFMVNVLLGKCEIAAADINGNGTVDLLDFVKLKKMIAASIG